MFRSKLESEIGLSLNSTTVRKSQTVDDEVSTKHLHPLAGDRFSSELNTLRMQ